MILYNCDFILTLLLLKGFRGQTKHRIINNTFFHGPSTKKTCGWQPYKEEGLKIAESLTSKGPEHLDLSKNDLGLAALKANCFGG